MSNRATIAILGACALLSSCGVMEAITGAASDPEVRDAASTVVEKVLEGDYLGAILAGGGLLGAFGAAVWRRKVVKARAAAKTETAAT